MKYLFCVTLCINFLFTFGQSEGEFYYSSGNQVYNKKNATVKYKITKIKKNIYKEIEYQYTDNNWNDYNSYNNYIFESDTVVQIEKYYNDKLYDNIVRKFKVINDSSFVFKDYKNDTIIQIGTANKVLPLIRQGKIEKYYKNGNKKTEAIFKNNMEQSNINWKENGDKDFDNIFNFFDLEKKPVFQTDYRGGLMEFIAKNIRYPEDAKEKGIQGKVYVQFLIMEDGSIGNIEILRGLYPSLDDEVIRVIKLFDKKWTSGKIGDKKVNVFFQIPINFKLN